MISRGEPVFVKAECNQPQVTIFEPSAFPSLLDENGERKTFERFLNDVRKVDETYNSHYLRAEYNFVQSSAEMAARWERFSEDGDRYNLQYRTTGDDKVRPEHAALNGVTLPPSDPFWEEYYPPNGWNCRCTVVQVRKSKYPATPHDEAMALGEEALQRDTKRMFRFNPGKEQKTFPDYNPYPTPSAGVATATFPRAKSSWQDSFRRMRCVRRVISFVSVLGIAKKHKQQSCASIILIRRWLHCLVEKFKSDYLMEEL